MNWEEMQLLRPCMGIIPGREVKTLVYPKDIVAARNISDMHDVKVE